ncbi:MAG: hypothetical protein BEN18_02570 [Epulopiscium sp. Nuni2H_MBin001]|nr:MAG: hypothetical protein BEN18_02570 [Epulopiscium sp. Nuni2H_MBin001]
MYYSGIIFASDDSNNYPIVTITFDNNKEIKIELYPNEAPNTVNNFIDLANQGFYEYTFVSKIIPGYFVQAGDPIGNGFGYPGYYIESECKFNGINNKISLTRGTVAMARGEAFDTEGSQFFILTEDARHLTGQYSAFGSVIEGMEVIDKLGTVELDNDYMPQDPIFITDISVELNGYEPESPEVITAY